MKARWLHAILLAGLCGFARLAMAGGEADELLAKIRKANDPSDQLGAIKSMVVHSRIRVDAEREGQLTVRLQPPDKMRIEAEGKDEQIVRGFDGTRGWQFSTKDGLREITGPELDAMRFQVQLAMPDTNFQEIFERVVVAGEEEIQGRPCHRLECTPKAAFRMPPMTIFVDRETNLVARTIEHHRHHDGEVMIVKSYDAYEDFAGIMMPTSIISKVGDQLIDLSIESINWNKEIDPSFFAMPQALAQ